MPSSRNLARAQAGRAAVLALIAGYVDAYAFLNYGVYVSFVSGNTTRAGLEAGQANFPQAGTRLLAVLVFVVGVFAGALLMHSTRRRTASRLFGVVAALLAVGALAAHFDAPAHWLGVTVLSLAMGCMSTAVAKVGGQSVNVGFMTGTLTNMARHLALALKRAPLLRAQGSWDTHRRRAALLCGLWGVFLVGALLAGAAASRFGAWTLLPPTLALLAMAVVERPSAPLGSLRSLRGPTRQGSVPPRR